MHVYLELFQKKAAALMFNVCAGAENYSNVEKLLLL